MSGGRFVASSRLARSLACQVQFCLARRRRRCIGQLATLVGSASFQCSCAPLIIALAFILILGQRRKPPVGPRNERASGRVGGRMLPIGAIGSPLIKFISCAIFARARAPL